jgi:protein-S-isoprenylcysteine O-methyltransferase Ste14
MHGYWPGLALGVIIGAYWARVLRMVLKFRRTTGRAANFVPPEPLGRALRVLWYPTVILWIAHPFISAFAPSHLPAPLRLLYHNLIIAWLAVAVAALTLAATLVCWKRMGKSWRMGIDPGEKTQLVVTGPYAYVRHPIYALSSLLMLATVIAVPTPLMIALAFIHIVFLQWEARREERHLAAAHGSEYGQYMRRVGRFIPRSVGGYHAH